MSYSSCIICCTNAKALKSICEASAESNVAIIVKLQFIAPEVEWFKEYCICQECLTQLTIACKFKEQCIKLKDFLLKREVSNDECQCHEIKQDLDCLEGQGDATKLENIQPNHELSVPNNESLKSEIERKRRYLKRGKRCLTVSSLKAHESTCDHILRHNKSKVKFQCNICKRYYTTIKTLKAHSKKCEINKTKKVPTKQLFNEHKRQGVDSDCEQNLHKRPTKKSTTFRTFLCEKCKAKFYILKDIIEHCVLTHSMEKNTVRPYLCEMCDARFKTSSTLKGHEMYHRGERPNICVYCGKGFIKSNELSVHEKTHLSIRSYKCDKCDKSFKTSANCRTHKLLVHTDPSNWQNVCKTCGKRFAQNSYLEQHMLRHIGEKNFICHICSRGFTTKNGLKKHEGQHSNFRQFKCEHCGVEYKKQCTYKFHLAKVHGIGNAMRRVQEKKFSCHICPAKFPEKGKLSRHLCVHTGLKPYPCTKCDRKFTEKSYLHHHLKVKHNIE